MTDKCALVVGAGPGLGRALAHAFGRQGLIVCVARRDGDAASALAQEVSRDTGTPAHGLALDARDEDQVAALFDQIEADIAPLEVVIFNAGGWHQDSIVDMGADLYRKVWETAAFAGFLVGRQAARAMVPRGAGTILFTGATASRRGSPRFSAFAGAKFALRALAQSMARELGPKGVHVAHVVIDGMIDTAGVRARFADHIAKLPDDGLLAPDAIAQTYVALHAQPRSAWSFEVDLRPWCESW